MRTNAVTAPGLGLTALLGPTNTGKTHRAIEQMLSHRSGMIGLPLRLLAREVYDRITREIGEGRVALLTGEEKRVPANPSYWVCTVESMPIERDVDFVAVDEIQLAAHRQRGHTFTQRLLHARGKLETYFMGSDTMKPMVESLLPTAGLLRHPRFSQLSYSGSHTLGGLPPRTAIVAFSAADVYQIAERIRQRHGGTAVVLGALSPRTRNAQVAMYEAGEVNYLVATDAIGMGLNLDLDRVVFSTLHKYDGRTRRELQPQEVGQIAGRAGRYTRDGSFGTLRPLAGLEPNVVATVEQQRFAPVTQVVWRNHDLDFTTLDALVASLRARPPQPRLRLVEQSDDFDALVGLAKRDDIRRLATNPAAIELLWEVCRIPDYRKLLLDSHIQLLAEIYRQLRSKWERLDSDWMRKRIARLEQPVVGIDGLMSRIAFVRTWTYITNHERWIDDGQHWQELTRTIEDKHSDALHEGLTARFVETRSTARVRPAGRRRQPAKLGPQASAEAVDPNHPFAQLLKLDVPGQPGRGQPTDPVQRAHAIVAARHDQLHLDHKGRIAFGDRFVGRLKAGSDLQHPQVQVTDADALGAGATSRIARRLTAWCRDAVGELLTPLRRLDADALSSAGRGVRYQLEQGLGSLDGRSGGEQLGALTHDDRAAFRKAGIEIGTVGAYLPSALRSRALMLRAVLWTTHARPSESPPVPDPAALSVPADPRWSGFLAHVGFFARGPRAIRADALMRADRALRALADQGEPFEIDPAIGAVIGCRKRQLPAVFRAMGYRKVSERGWIVPKSGRPTISRRRGRSRRRR